MRIALATDHRGRTARCPICDKPVPTRQRVQIVDGKPYHAACIPKETSMTDQTRSHPMCWQDDHYEHECARPSGRTCIDCVAPAGTPWGPYWCPACDVERLDRIAVQLEDLATGDWDGAR